MPPESLAEGTTQLYRPRSYAEAKSGNRKRLQVAATNHALSVWKEPGGCYALATKLLQHHVHSGSKKTDSETDLKKQGTANLMACRRKTECGQFAAAIGLLSSSGVSPCSEKTYLDLQDKHPPAHSPAIPDDVFLAEPITVDSRAVLGAIKSFPKGTSCGRDGLRDQHLVDVMSGADVSVADNLLASIIGVVNLWLAGTCPASLGEFVASPPLTPLLKPGGGIRPIVVGTVWRILVSKVAAFSVGKDMTSYLGDYQFGVGVPAGGEGILHVVNCLLEMKGHSDKMSMLLIDFSNAFNMVRRTQLIKEVRLHCPGISRWVEFCYLRLAKLYYDQYILSSALGVQQGDPLGPLLFALTLHPLVKSIASRCTLDLHAWYLDDSTIIGDTLEPSIDPRSTTDGVFPSDIGRPSNGVKLIGGPVGLDLNFISGMLLTRVSKTVQLMSVIKKLKDPHSEMLLFRNCTGVSRLYFAMRTTNPAALQPATDLFDDHLFKYLRLLITGDGAGFGPLQQRLATLPIKEGGLGIYTMADTRAYCYLASQSQTASVKKIILGNLFSTNKGSAYQLVLQNFIQCNRVNHAQDYILAIPISGLNQCFSPRQLRVVLCYRLDIPLFVEDSL
ncbi:uncharacterized protein LOC113305956 [Papaver somniferum]|uniref:uncharacterized protein LOC113305956 n=1 Tax=Papaver somniferum TaxID=3469 RepID=UPI000E6FE515|nr:uncharacterized protein LOC113305956 [Papaver somniferum]